RHRCRGCRWKKRVAGSWEGSVHRRMAEADRLPSHCKSVYTLSMISEPRKIRTATGPGKASPPARRPAPLPRANPEALESPGDGDASSTETIVNAVMRAIVEHRLLPGAKLVEQKLGDRFGVSRTVVRQALFRLSELKLVRLEPARGAFVAAPSIQEAREVFAVR